ncbi:MAG: hypothetical protein IBX69_03620 [Anaerolineales bacterium]|nr:hypothetical protein [Anaerolineales bacterium]
MRITREILYKIAADTVAKRVRTDRSLLAVYLHGSLMDENPLLGGATDIDLVFVHDDNPPEGREIEILTDEVHLDIAHHARHEYRDPRTLRLHPWLGPTIVGCKILYDPQHFMDFTQASVGGQFYRPDFVLQRGRGMVEHARQMWFSLHGMTADPTAEDFDLYLKAVEHVANGIASLEGPPLTERRFLIRFPKRAEAVEKPGLYAGLIGLLGGAKVEAGTIESCLDGWQAALDSIAMEEIPAGLHPGRQSYYRRAFEAMLEGEHPHDVLWPLLRTWTSAILQLHQEAVERETWKNTLEQWDLMGSGFHQRVSALDAYLDVVEETMETWGVKHGA